MYPNPHYRHGMQLLGRFLLFHSLHNWDNNSKLKYTEWLTEWEVKFNTLKERISNLLKNLLTLPEEVSSVAQANKHLVDLPTSYVHDNCIYYHLSCFKKITHTRYQYPAVPSTSTSTPTKRSAAQSVASLHTETVEVSFTLFSTICMYDIL